MKFSIVQNVPTSDDIIFKVFLASQLPYNAKIKKIRKLIKFEIFDIICYMFLLGTFHYWPLKHWLSSPLAPQHWIRNTGLTMKRNSSLCLTSVISPQGGVYGRSEGYARTGYGIPGRDGMGAGGGQEILPPPSPSPPPARNPPVTRKIDFWKWVYPHD